MAARDYPRDHVYIIAMTAFVVVVVALLVAIPGRVRYSEEELWHAFDLADAPPGGPDAVLAHARRVATGEWRISATRESSIGSHTHYEQLVSGRVVIGAWAQSHDLGVGGRTLVGRAVQVPAPSTMTSPSRDPVAIAREAVGVASLRAEPRATPALLPTTSGLVPVTRVSLPAGVPLGDWIVMVDDASGEVLLVDDHLSLRDGVGDVFERVPDVPCDAGPHSSDATLAPYISSATLAHLTETGYLDGRYVRTLNGGDPRVRSEAGVYEYLPSHPGFEQVMCYYTITRYFARIESLGVEGYRGAALVADAHGYPGDNSFYSPSTGQLSFGDGGVPDAQDPEIILHELGHALHHRAHPSYPLSYTSRALSEGIADYVACSFFDDARLAEWDASAYSDECPPYLRRLDRYLRYPDDLSGSVHQDGQIWSTALWAVRDALGADVTDRVLLESLFLLPATAGPPDAAQAFLRADAIVNEGRYGRDAEEIFRDRGILAGGVPAELTVPGIFARAFPNPFRDTGTIRYVLPGDGRVRVDITDVRGRLVRKLLNGRESGGSHTVTWDGRDEADRDVPEGIYFYRITSGDLSTSGKLVYLP